MLRLLLLVCLPLSAQWGSYRNTVKVEFEPDGRKMRLLADFIYEDPTGRKWIAPAGWLIDGASIPQLLWSTVGGPYEGKYREASVIHDYECDKKVSPWQEVHLRFYFGMLARGVEPMRAMGMYWAVKEHGPKWDLSGTAIPRSELVRAELDRVVRYIGQRERGEIMQPAVVTDPALRNRVDLARDQVTRAKAGMAAANAYAIQATVQSEPKNELELFAREELRRKAEERKVAAAATVARADAELQEVEAEVQRVAGPPRPMPPIGLEELKALTLAQIPR